MVVRKLSLLLPPLNYMTLHYLYFIVTILLFSFIFWLSSSPSRSISYIDCLFMVTSAMTETGLNTVNLSDINTLQQVILFILMIGGSSIFVSYFVVLVSKRAFESRFSELAELYKTRRPSSAPILHYQNPGNGGASSTANPLHVDTITVLSSPYGLPAGVHKDQITPNVRASQGTAELTNPGSLFTGRDEESFGINAAHDPPPVLTERVRTFSYLSFNSGHQTMQRPYEPEKYAPNASVNQVQVNSQTKLEHSVNKLTHFSPPIEAPLRRTTSDPDSQISQEDRMQLGGSEYGALKLLTYLIPTYFVGWQLVGCFSAALYIVYRCGDIAKSNATNPWWLGIFLGVSAFNNCGLSLLDTGMTPFGMDTYLLMTLSILIMAGYIAYPIVLRSLLWLLFHALPRSEEYHSWKETTRFILKYPRRVYTNVFPAAHTWWLLFALIVFTAVDWLSFDVLNLANQAIVSIPFSFRQTIGFFQSISIRSAGFSIVPVSVLAVGTQVISVVTMYISAYPVLIPLRSSNVYEERSLGIYKGDLPAKKTEKESEDGLRTIIRRSGPETKLFFLRQQLEHQLAHDVWWLTVSIIFIVCFEADNNNRDPITYSIFNMIFEVVSAYGPVGLSTGLPNEPYSLSGGFHTVSKVLICAVMIRGRHRGLPVAIDKAVLLPSEISDRREEVAHLLHESE